MEPRLEVGELLDELCACKGLSGPRLAERLSSLGYKAGIRPNTIAQWKRRNPPVAALPYLEKALALSSEELLEWRESVDYTKSVRAHIYAGYTVADAKERAERLSPRREARGGTSEGTRSPFDLPYVRNKYEFFDVTNQQPYDYPTSLALRQRLESAENPSLLLDWATEIIHETWQTHKRGNTIRAGLLDARYYLWIPRHNILRDLQDLCRRSLDDRDTTQVTVIQHLGCAFAKKEMPTVHRDYMYAEFNTPAWRKADIWGMEEYYGSQTDQLSAYARHMREPEYIKLLRADDVVRLLHVLQTTYGINRSHTLRMLDRTLTVLHECGEVALAKAVIKEVNFTLNSQIIGE